MRVTSGGVRITDITVVLHERRAVSSASFGPARPVPLGVLRVTTDEGIEGNAFLSSPGPGPAAIADQIVTQVKPWLLGADPARHRQALAADAEPVPLPVAARRRHRRHRAVGHRGPGRGAAGAPAARHLPRPHPRLLLHRSPRHRAGLRRRGALLAGAGLEGLQAAPAARAVAPAGQFAPCRRRHRGVRGGAGRGRRRHDADARLLVELLLHRGAQGRPGDPGPRLSLVRGPVPRPRHPQLRPPRQAPEHPAAGHRDQPGRPRPRCRRGSPRAPPTSCAATWSSRAASPG